MEHRTDLAEHFKGDILFIRYVAHRGGADTCAGAKLLLCNSSSFEQLPELFIRNNNAINPCYAIVTVKLCLSVYH